MLQSGLTMTFFLSVLVFSTILTLHAAGEMFSAMAHMEKLVTAEKELAFSLDRYLQAEEERLDKIKAIARVVSNVSEAANADVQRYLGHPVNAYRLLRRFTSDWNEIENLVVHPVTSEGIFRCVLLERVVVATAAAAMRHCLFVCWRACRIKETR